MPHYSIYALLIAALALSANGYWLMGAENFITTERLDPIVSPGKVSGHVHSVLGGSNFGMTTNTASLKASGCTSVPIPQDKSNYWFPHLYFEWANGSFTSLEGGAVMYYLFSDQPGTTTAFPDDFRMLSGDSTLRTFDSNSFAQQAVSFICLDFGGTSTRHNSLPQKSCPSGIRAQINFPSCWDGKNLDSSDHKSHVAFLSGGPDQGTCNDPNYPVTLARIFLEVYWSSNSFDAFRSQAKDSNQPFVFANGDPTGYGYHADFLNGWDSGILQNAVDKCHCDQNGDPTCCVDQGIFSMNKGEHCYITKTVDEPTTGTLAQLPGNNPVQKRATIFTDSNTPTLLSTVYGYTGDAPITPVPPALSPDVPPSAALPSNATDDSTPSADAPSKPDSSNPDPADPSTASPHPVNVSPSYVGSESDPSTDPSPHSCDSPPLPSPLTPGMNDNGAPGTTGPSPPSSPVPTIPKCKSRHKSPKVQQQSLPHTHASDKKSRRLVRFNRWAS